MMIGKRAEVKQISKRNHNCKQNNFPETLAKICDWLYLVLQLNFCLSSLKYDFQAFLHFETILKSLFHYLRGHSGC